MNNAQLTFVHALSALHAGVGQGAGVIDLPIAREKATGLPFLPGSSVKGALRTRAFLDAKEKNAENLETLYTCIFGPENNDGPDARASMVQFSDQKLLLLPIRSLAGTFAWVTSPYILQRLARDIKDIGPSQQESPSAIPAVNKTSCLTTSNAAAIIMTSKKKVYLEDLDLEVQADNEQQRAASEWADWIGDHAFHDEQNGKDKKADNNAWQKMLRDRFCIVHDDVFNFLITTATEVTARIRLQDNSKTVVDGGLWYEEALPTETILSGMVIATPHKDERVRNCLKQNHDLTPKQIFNALKEPGNTAIQLGGKATVGRGLCRVRLVSNGQANNEEGK